MRRQALQLVVGLLLGLLGAALVFAYVRSVRTDSADQGRTVTTLVAGEDIAAGTPGGSLEPMVQATEIPARYAPEGAVADLRQVEGLFATEAIRPGETLLASMFSAAGATRGGQLAIPEGTEAIAVTTSVAGGLAYYLAPGDHVSVYATFRDTGRKVTRKILADVPVLATQAGGDAGENLAGAATSELVIVLALTPEEAGRLVFGREVGSIWMTLVPQGQGSPMVPPVTQGAIRVHIACTGDQTSAGCEITGKGA
ncbi:MAG: Flp pilus assembly protein CpaB [Actinomycetota bacterium]